MVVFAKTFFCLTFLIFLVESISMFNWFYRMLSYWFKHGVILTKDNNKLDVFLHALGEASAISFFVSTNVSFAGFCWWGAYDESGFAWFFCFLVFLIPFDFFSIFCYKGCSEIFKMEQAQKERDSESVER